MRRSAAVFTALVLLLTAAVAAPFFVGADPDLLMIVVPLGMFAPFVAALATWMLVAGRRPAFGEAFATRRFGPGLLLALGVFVAIAALQPVIGTALGIAEWRSPADPVGVGLALVAQFAIMLVASIGEELGWRGWLFTLLRPRGFWFTALVTTAIWTVWHLPIVAINVVQGFDSIGGAALALASVAAVGPLFAALRERSGSVWPAVLAHALMNSLLLAVDEHLVAPVEGAARLAWLAIVWLLALAAAFALVGARRRPAGSFSAPRTSDGLQRVRITAVEQG